MQTENASKRRNAWYLLFVFGSVGFALFSIFPALIFTALEGWPFADSLYFTIITLTTIGFGDLVPGEFRRFRRTHALVSTVNVCILCLNERLKTNKLNRIINLAVLT